MEIITASIFLLLVSPTPVCAYEIQKIPFFLLQVLGGIFSNPLGYIRYEETRCKEPFLQFPLFRTPNPLPKPGQWYDRYPLISYGGGGGERQHKARVQ